MDGIGRELFSNAKLILVYLVLVGGFVIGTLLFSKGINKLLDTVRKPFFFVICGLSIGSVASVFFGNDCMNIYHTWKKADILIEIPVGVAFLLVGVAITLGIYLWSKRKETKNAEKNI